MMAKFLLSVALALFATAAQAQTKAAFPSRLITLVVPFTSNSGSDIVSRLIAPKLAARWGQAVIVENKAGASGNLGADFVAKAPADGHTLLMAINTFTMTPWLYSNVPFDPAADFAPVAKLAEASFALAVNPRLPVKDVASLFAYVKAKPGQINFATPGKGTPHHLAMELLKARYGLDVVHVPYRGIAGALTDLTAGEVQMMLGSVPSMSPFEQAGTLRFLAVTGPVRQPLAPKIPTFREQGISVMDDVDAWYGVLAPARTPPDLVARLNADFVSVMNADDVKAQLEKLGVTVMTSSAPEFGAIIKADLLRWQKVVTDAGITAD